MSIKRLIMLISAVAILISMNITVLAYDKPDLEKSGSVQVFMRYGDKAVSGGTLTIYRVGTFEESDGQYGFVLTDSFVDCYVSLSDIQSSESAKALYEFARENSIDGETKEIGTDGNISFENLSVGLYLFVQETAALGGYEKAAPFLVSVPMEQNGEYVYDVDASPKVELKKEPESTTTPHDGPFSESGLPATGQLNWPIPILVMSGLLMIICGCFFCFGKRKAYEK